MASKKVVKQYVQRLRKDYILKSRLLFFMYAYFIVDRTLLSRPFGWSNGMQNIMGGWGLLDPETGQVTLEAVENFSVFCAVLVPFFLGFPAYKVCGMHHKEGNCYWILNFDMYRNVANDF